MGSHENRFEALQGAAPIPLGKQMSQKSKMKARPGKAAAMPSGAVRLNERWTVLGVCIFLTAIVWVVFGQTLHHEFVNFDDDQYVYENPQVIHGLTLHGIA